MSDPQNTPCKHGFNDDELRALGKLIWKHHPRTPGSYAWSEETRPLTDDEMAGILGATTRLIVEPHNACMGFGFGITLWVPPLFPGLECAYLISVTNRHISTTAGFDAGWEKFWPHVDTEQNRAWLAHHGFEPLKDRGSYDY